MNGATHLKSRTNLWSADDLLIIPVGYQSTHLWELWLIVVPRKMVRENLLNLSYCAEICYRLMVFLMHFLASWLKPRKTGVTNGLMLQC